MPAGVESTRLRGSIVLLAAVSIGLAACHSAPPASAEASAPASAARPSDAPSSAAQSQATSPSAKDEIAGRFDVGGGRTLYLECQGSGGPTILFLHGYGGLNWHGSHLFDYADRHRVCTYTRANMGQSDPSDGIQSGADIVDDAVRLMAAAGVDGPYLIVAASHGGIIAEVFAGTHPDEVVGIVLVDASLHADGDVDRYFAGIGELDLEAFQAEYAAGEEATAWTIHDEAKAALATIPDVPITYLLALQEDRGLPAEADAIWQDGLADLLARSSHGRIVEVDGPHVLPPEPIHAAIDEILALLAAP